MRTAKQKKNKKYFGMNLENFKNNMTLNLESDSFFFFFFFSFSQMDTLSLKFAYWDTAVSEAEVRMEAALAKLG